MIRVTYSDLNNPNFTAALGKLVNYNGFKIKVAYSISKMVPKLQKELNSARELFQKLMFKYAEKNEDGTPIFSPDGRAKVAEDKQVEFDQEISQLLSMGVEIPYNKIDIQDLDGVNLSAAELSAIDNIIQESEEPTGADETLAKDPAINAS